jgi:hypothetical protein
MARPRTGLSVRRRHPAAHRGRRASRSGRPATPCGIADPSNPHNIARAPRVRAWAVSVRRPRATPPLGWPASENLHHVGHLLGALHFLKADKAHPALADRGGREADSAGLEARCPRCERNSPIRRRVHRLSSRRESRVWRGTSGRVRSRLPVPASAITHPAGQGVPPAQAPISTGPTTRTPGDRRFDKPSSALDGRSAEAPTREGGAGRTRRRRDHAGCGSRSMSLSRVIG